MNRQVAANIRLKYFNLRCWMKHIQLVKNTALAIAQRFPLYMTIKTVVCVCVCVCVMVQCYGRLGTVELMCSLVL